MHWKGIPFSFEPSMLLEHGFITVNKIPTVVVDSGFAWDTVIATLVGSIVAGWVPGIIALKSIKSNERNTRITIAIDIHKRRIEKVKEASSNYMANIISTGVYVSSRKIDGIPDDDEYKEKTLSFIEKENFLRNVLLLNFTNNSDKANEFINKLNDLIKLNSHLFLDYGDFESVFNSIKKTVSELLLCVKSYCDYEDDKFYKGIIR